MLPLKYMYIISLYILLSHISLRVMENSSIMREKIHFVSKNDTNVAHHNFNAYQPILIIFGRDIAERVCYQMVSCYPTSPN